MRGNWKQANKQNQNQRKPKVLYDFYLKHSLAFKGFDWKSVSTNSHSSHTGLLQLTEELNFQFNFTSINFIVILKVCGLERWLRGGEQLLFLQRASFRSQHLQGSPQ